jgi:hypothetical protein
VKIDLQLSGAHSPGDAVAVELLSVEVDAVVTLIKEHARSVSYYSQAPATVKVDGAFADWNGIATNSDSDPVPLPERLDITGTRGTNRTASGGPAFLVSAAGVAMAGDPMPAKTVKPAAGPGGGPVVLPRVNGEDSLQLYLDVGPSPATGQTVGGLGADYRVTVVGENGRVRVSTLERWGAGWTRAGSVEAQSQGGSVELEVAKGLIDWSAGPEVASYVELRGWDGTRDTAQGVRMIDPAMIAGNGSLYVSSGGPYLFRGTAPGATPSLTYNNLVYSGSRLYALRGDAAVYQTDDYGLSWAEAAPVCTDNACPDTDFSSFATDGQESFYSVQVSGEGYRCIAPCMTGGWVFLGGGSASADLVHVSGAGVGATLYGIVLGPNSKMRLSVDGGDNWDLGGMGNTGTSGTNQTALGRWLNGSIPEFFVLTEGGQMVHSTDDGASWTPVARPPPLASPPDSYTDLSIDPSNGRIYIVLTDGTTSYWQPGDMSWTQISGPPGVAGVSGIVHVRESSWLAVPASMVAAGFLALGVRRRRHG